LHFVIDTVIGTVIDNNDYYSTNFDICQALGGKKLKYSGIPKMAMNNHISTGPLINQRKLTAYGDCDNSSSKERHQ
jgi:hypothetical protein